MSWPGGVDPGLAASSFRKSTPAALVLHVGRRRLLWGSPVVLALLSVARLLSLRPGTAYRRPHRAQAPAQVLWLRQIVAPAFGGM